MQIQLHASNGIDNKDSLDRWADDELRRVLRRFDGEVTRVEVHLSDENHDVRGGVDKRCVMEARLAGRPPLAVTQQGSNLDEAFRGACDKLERALASALDREADHRRRESIRHAATDGAGAGAE